MKFNCEKKARAGPDNPNNVYFSRPLDAWATARVVKRPLNRSAMMSDDMINAACFAIENIVVEVLGPVPSFLRRRFPPVAAKIVVAAVASRNRGGPVDEWEIQDIKSAHREAHVAPQREARVAPQREN